MFMMTSRLSGCVLSTNETNEAVKVSCIHPQGPYQHMFFQLIQIFCGFTNQQG